MADEVFDYVVVGAGSAGAAAAARLSEDPTVTVALIEAGAADSADEIHIPVAFGSLFKSPWDWDLDSEPEPGLLNRRAYLPRGKMLGGCSSMNAMIYIRGNRLDYDEWATNGATGWSYDDVLPIFRRFEDNERGASEFHGAGGPLAVSESRSENHLAESWIDAAVEAGYELNDDFNGESQIGVGRYQVTQRNGMRCSTAVAYLHPNLDRPNLTVMTDTLARRVMADSTRATGVEISRGGDVSVVHAANEVIVSAGAYGSPHLLLLSGIGPKEQLEAFQIPVLADLPVGQGLQDHYMVLLNYLTDQESLMTALSPENAARLQTEGRGPLTSNVGEAGGFFITRPELAAPNVQFHLAPVLFYNEGTGPAVAHGFGQGPCVVKPTSRGSVTLRTANPESAPRIVHNYLTTAEDQQAIIDGLRIAVDLASRPALKSIITGDFVTPVGTSDAELLNFAQRAGQTLYHPTSTCAIGAVVDPQLKVYGFENLRVADASVMPSVIRGNTNATSILIGERVADFAQQGS
ncbi:MAG TPA: GMC family oxidoreductase N-terminal domain-containing protein [Aeromicrobium sp.]|nr:GMC family oxidoreductase N-terminal domain-containing protein [Aeromicrobium sp.]HKY56968.1 GMC family oxidoreductase N-terminal domain-containing protein [Aeromicrobium sp.]